MRVGSFGRYVGVERGQNYNRMTQTKTSDSVCNTKCVHLFVHL